MGEGIDIRSDVGRCLLCQMVKYGYSEDRMSIQKYSIDDSFEIYSSEPRLPIAEVSATTEVGVWRVYVWKEILYHPNKSEDKHEGEWMIETVCSKYDVYGK